MCVYVNVAPLIFPNHTPQETNGTEQQFSVTNRLSSEAADSKNEVDLQLDEAELNYSDVDLSDSDTMEECYRIFMEDNRGKHVGKISRVVQGFFDNHPFIIAKLQKVYFNLLRTRTFLFHGFQVPDTETEMPEFNLKNKVLPEKHGLSHLAKHIEVSRYFITNIRASK